MTERICFLQWPKGARDGASPSVPRKTQAQWDISVGHSDLQHRQLYEGEEKALYKEFHKIKANLESVTGGTDI